METRYSGWAQCTLCQCISPEEIVEIAIDIINAAGENGFAFKLVGLADVHARVKHFTSQASGEDGIPQSVVAKVLAVIGDRLVGFYISIQCVFCSRSCSGALEEGKALGSWKGIYTTHSIQLQTNYTALLSF